jgi:uncharacterized protein YggT (Ycf19 family)
MVTLATAVNTLFDVYEIIIIVWCVLSWFPRKEGGWLDDVAQVLNGLVQPYLGIFRKFIPPMGGLDWSPMIAILALGLLQNLIVRILISI